MDFNKNVTELVSKEKLDVIMLTKKVSMVLELDPDTGTHIVTYNPVISKDICDLNGIDYTKALRIDVRNDKSIQKRFSSVSIYTASAILSYSRIHMSYLFKYIEENKGSIYYTDTDSIFTDIKLPDHMIDDKKLGKLKLDSEILEAYFVADKQYYYINKYGQEIKKAKGVDSSKLSKQDYIDLYNSKIINTAVKTMSKRDYYNGSVLIQTKNNILLDNSIYKKRVKV